MKKNETKSFSDELHISKNAPMIPQGATLGKESMIYSYSNAILEIAAFINISDAARTFYLYMTTIILDETHKALNQKAYDFSENSRRFHFNIREFLSFTKTAGKKNYTFEEIQTASQELVGRPLTFVSEDNTIFDTVAFFSEIKVDTGTGDCFFDVATSLLTYYVPELSERKEQHLISLIESFKFSNSYADALYRLINGYVQTVDLIQDYSIPILVLKRKMGLTQEHTNWNNKFFILRVLDKAVELINNSSDIHIDYETIKYDKQNKIKDIKFINIKRKETGWMQRIEERSVDMKNSTAKKEVVTVEPIYEKTIDVNENIDETMFKDIDETELTIAKILTVCKKSGLPLEQSTQISEKYKDNYNRFKGIYDMFQTAVKCGMKQEADRYKFFMKPELDD